jgi:hypothetical protein
MWGAVGADLLLVEPDWGAYGKAVKTSGKEAPMLAS